MLTQIVGVRSVPVRQKAAAVTELNDLNSAAVLTAEYFSAALLVGAVSISAGLLDPEGLREFIRLGLASVDGARATLTSEGVRVVSHYLNSDSGPL